MSDCRADRWHGEPHFEGRHRAHLFTYGPHGVYTGSCTGFPLHVAAQPGFYVCVPDCPNPMHEKVVQP